MKLLFTLLVMLPLSVFCQQPDSVKTHQVAIGLTFSPDYCYRISTPNHLRLTFGDLWTKHQSPVFGFTTGINLAIKLTKRFSIGTGVLFAQGGIKQNKFSTDYWEINSNEKIYRTTYLTIPLQLHYYYFLGEKVKLYAIAGISPSFHTGKDRTPYYGLWTTYERPFVIDWVAIAGVGINYNINKRLYFTAEPTFRCLVSPIYDNSFRPFSAGLNTGVFYRL